MQSLLSVLSAPKRKRVENFLPVINLRHVVFILRLKIDIHGSVTSDKMAINFSI